MRATGVAPLHPPSEAASPPPESCALLASSPESVAPELPPELELPLLPPLLLPLLLPLPLPPLLLVLPLELLPPLELVPPPSSVVAPPPLEDELQPAASAIAVEMPTETNKVWRAKVISKPLSLG